MSLTEIILDHALNFFDVASGYPISMNESLLILGLESTPQRDLDYFEKFNNRLIMKGFKTHVKSKLEGIINRASELGISTKLVGKYGYVLKGSSDFINYKTMAIRTGLGKRGKNSAIINHAFGSRLRFAVLKLTTLLENHKDYIEKKSSFCKDCSICIDECPEQILKPYRMTDATKCLSNISNNPAVMEGKPVSMCDICLKRCPANKIGVKPIST